MSVADFFVSMHQRYSHFHSLIQSIISVVILEVNPEDFQAAYHIKIDIIFHEPQKM